MFQYLSWLARDVALRDACSMYFTHGSMRLYLRDRAHPVGSRSEGVPIGGGPGTTICGQQLGTFSGKLSALAR